MIGQRFGRLVALRIAQASFVECQCDCGNCGLFNRQKLRRGTTRSCGCLARELTIARSSTHGHTRGKTVTPEYRAWMKAKRRVSPNNLEDHHNYLGRGITMCREFSENFEAFLAEVGDRPSASHTIDRIDNDKGYEPGNIRWATMREQSRNRRGTKITPDMVRDIRASRGILKQSDIAQKYGIAKSLVCSIQTGRSWSDII